MCAARLSIKGAAASSCSPDQGKPLLLPPSSGSHHRRERFKILAAAGISAFLLLSLTFSPLWSLHARHRPILSRTSSSISSSAATTQQPRRSYDVLHYTALEASDGDERDRIRQLLDERSSAKYYWHHGRGGRGRVELEHSDGYERRRPTPIRRLRDRRWTPDLSNPRYAPYTGEFRQMLQSWARRKRYDPEIMAELLPAIKEPIDRHYKNLSTTTTTEDELVIQEQAHHRHHHHHTKEDDREGHFGDQRRSSSPSPSPYPTCAVVGNSGVLLNRTYGALIDSYQMVMRLNNAKVAGFERWVGSKTTISFVNSNIVHSCARRHRCSCPSYGDAVPTVSYVCQVAHFLDLAYCRAHRRAPLLVTDPRFDSLATRIVRYYSLRHFFHTTGRSYDDWNKLHDGTLFHYSSGMQAVMLALGICDEVGLFGFGKLSNSTHHYHTNQRTELALHDYEAEYILYRDLVHRPGMVPFLNESGLAVPPVKIFL
ncbi:beta-1,6-galactosyltransferase GALT29A [Selaginella moellendorffii]|uniref:beta-1,6-galactosyltransferase GALT29A n=1 Tax=Selaginella moellendorffii TaxID=88036 RepID=UPI000D1CE080|nr:beta-1,6-galactosyltransferase GALT29A [Selaginella moellendorffii]|eukprot:XP_024534335.1 beta-1,6-galactosyltransferase GALT29A [Selaginella moellendorffii]